MNQTAQLILLATSGFLLVQCFTISSVTVTDTNKADWLSKKYTNPLNYGKGPSPSKPGPSRPSKLPSSPSPPSPPNKGGNKPGKPNTASHAPQHSQTLIIPAATGLPQFGYQQTITQPQQHHVSEETIHEQELETEFILNSAQDENDDQYYITPADEFDQGPEAPAAPVIDQLSNLSSQTSTTVADPPALGGLQPSKTQGNEESNIPLPVLQLMSVLGGGGSLAQASKPEKNDSMPGYTTANAIGYATGDNATVTAAVSNKLELSSTVIILTESATASASSNNGTAFSQATLSGNGYAQQLGTGMKNVHQILS